MYIYTSWLNYIVIMHEDFHLETSMDNCVQLLKDPTLETCGYAE